MKSAALFLKPTTADASPQLLKPISSATTLGRGHTADVQLNELRCNNLHALIEPADDGTFNLIDLGSHFGTFKNNHRIDEEKLSLGEEFRIGSQILFIGELESSISPINSDLAKRVVTFPSRKKELLTEKNLLQVSLYWGQQQLDVRTFEKDSTITIGSQKEAVFNIPLSSDAKDSGPYSLATYTQGELTLNLPIEVAGLVWIGSDAISVDSLRHRDRTQKEFGHFSVKLRVGDRAHLEIGELSLEFEFISPSDKIPLYQTQKIDPKLKKILSGMLGLWVLILVLMALYTPEQKETTLEDIPDHLKKVLYDAGIAEAIKKQQSAIGQIAANLEGGRARAEEGQATANKSPEKPKASQQQKPVAKAQQPNSPQVSQLDIQSAFDNATDAPATPDSILGEKTLGNTATALKGGNFARGTSGLGAGGGGESVGIGQLKGLSTGGGMGAGNYGLAPSKGREIDVPVIEETEVQGGLDPEVIAAVIRRYLPQIRHCYEQNLTISPNLKGKVKVSFVINGSGAVSTASVAESTLNHQKTENCIIGKVKTWQFPKPKGGGNVGVNYPFMLMSNSGSQ